MLTVMCPNCRHRFPAPGCCNPGTHGTIVTNNDESSHVVQATESTRNNDAFCGGGYLLVPREYNDNNNRNCFINAPTIIHGPTIIQQPTILNKISDDSVIVRDNETWIKFFNQQQQLRGNCSKANGILDDKVEDSKIIMKDEFTGCHIGTTCDLTGGTVTITTPNMQSGGCLIRSKDSEIIVQSPKIEIRPKLSGGGCFVQKNIPFDITTRNDTTERQNDENLSYRDNFNFENLCPLPPSGCQELPGMRYFSSSGRSNRQNHRQIIVDSTSTSTSTISNECNSRNVTDPIATKEEFHRDCNNDTKDNRRNFCNTVNDTKIPNANCCCVNRKNIDSTSSVKNTGTNCPLNSAEILRNETIDGTKKIIDNNGSMQIRVNATVQLPPNVGHCTVNITATTGNSKDSGRIVTGRRDNFNGGGLINIDGNNCNDATVNNSPTTTISTNNERREDPPTTPLSWLMPCPWGFDNYPIDKDVTRLSEIKKLLQISGWYHEGISWQQSETLLKNAPVGRWLMRDSSDSRFIFAVSVQTTRGLTSVRVHYFLGRFRLDAEPRLSLAMPLFECPIKMLQHYVDYSKRIDEHRKEVWVDYSGQLYSQIYLTKPLVKEVQTLSHLARIVVNSNKLYTDNLPPLIKSYLAEYPYSL